MRSELNVIVRKVVHKFKEFLQSIHIPISENNGEIVVQCPVCGFPSAKLYDSNWDCIRCEGKGDVIAYAKAFFKMRSDEEALKEVCRCLNIPFPFLTFTTAKDLLQTEFAKQESIVEGILAPGLYILAGAPKLGKSWLALQTAVAVSMGQPIWEHNTMQGEVLYLSLEDPAQRMQGRLRSMYTENVLSAENIYFTYEASLLGEGLEEQLREFLNAHKKVRLVIIDTLGKIKVKNSTQYNYFEDYAMISLFRGLVAQFSVAILIIHHTRKLESPDSMAMISGTNGLFGAADGAMVMQRSDRLKDTAILSVTSKDFPDCQLKLYRDKKTNRWELCSGGNRNGSKEDDIVAAVKELMKSVDYWEGSATELHDVITTIDPGIRTSPNSLIRKLNEVSGLLKARDKIRFINGREGNGKIKILERIVDIT